MVGRRYSSVYIQIPIVKLLSSLHIFVRQPSVNRPHKSLQMASKYIIIYLEAGDSMAKVKKTTSEEPKSFRPALTPEARENQIISLAMNTAEQRIRDNTASDTLVCHFLKLGTSKYQLELEKLRSEEKLNQAKIDSIKSSEEQDELYKQAIAAMMDYSGSGEVGDDYDKD